MKKKLIQILMLLVAAVSVGSFVSCKDTNEDLYNELHTQTAQALAENASLQDALQRWKDDLQKQIDAYNELLKKIKSCTCTSTTVDLTDITDAISDLNDSITVHRTDIDNLADDVNTQLAGLTALINTLQTALTNGLNDKADKSALAALELLIRQLETQVLVNKSTLENLPDLTGTVADNTTQIAVLKYAVDQLTEKLNNITSQTGSTGQTTDLSGIITQLAGLQADMLNVKDLIDYAMNLATSASKDAADAKTQAAQALAEITRVETIANNATSAAQTAIDIATNAQTLASLAQMNVDDAKAFAQQAYDLALAALKQAEDANALAYRVTTLEGAVVTLNDQVGTNTAEIAALRAELQNNTATIQKLVADNKAELLKEISDAKQELLAEIIKNATQIAKNTQAIEQNTQAIARILNNIDDINGDITEIYYQLGILSSDVAKALADASAANAQAQTNRADIAYLRGVLESLQQTLAATNNANETRFQSIEDEIEDLWEAIQGLGTTLEAKIDALSTTVGDHYTEFTALKSKVEQALKDLEKAGDETKESVKLLNGRINDLETELKALELVVTYLATSTKNDLETAKAYADKQIALMKKELEEQIQELLTNFLQNHPDIDLSKYVTREEVQAYMQQYATQSDLFAAISGVNDDIRTLTETDAALKIAILNLTAQVVANGMTIKDIQDRIDDLSKQVGDNTKDISWLKYFYNQINGRVTTLENKSYITREEFEGWQQLVRDALANAGTGTVDTDAIIAAVTEKVKETLNEKIIERIIETFSSDEFSSTEFGSAFLERLEELGYITKDDLDGYLTADDLPDLSEYLKIADLAGYGFITRDDLPDITGLLTEADVKNLVLQIFNVTKLEELAGVAGFEDRIKKLEELLTNNAGLLGGRLDDIESRLKNVEDFANDIALKIEGLANVYVDIATFNDLKSNLANNYYTKTDVNNIIDNYYNKTEIDGFLLNYVRSANLATLLQEYAKISDLSIYAKLTDIPSIPNLDGYAKLTDIPDLTNYLHIDEFTLTRDELINCINALPGNITDFQNRLNAIEGDLPGMKTDIANLKIDVATNTNAISGLQTLVDGLTADVKLIKAQLDKIQNQLAKQVTGIIIQGTKNPMFGTFSIPVNIQSNILVAYYGLPTANGEFPTYKTGHYGNKQEQAFSRAEINELINQGLEQFEYYNNEPILNNTADPLENEEGTAGKIYMTINPNTADLDGLQMSIVNTLDEEAPLRLRPIVKSNDKLQFGFTRANNGFYEAEAYIEADDINEKDNGVPLTREDILNSFKDAREQLSNLANNFKSGNTDLGQLAIDVYQVIRGLKMDQSGLKCTYTTTEQSADGTPVETEHSVYSQYNLAATFLTPLNLDTAKDFNFVTMPGYEAIDGFFKRITGTLKNKVHGAFYDLNHSALINKIINFKIQEVKVDTLTEEFLAKFKIRVDTTITVDGIDYTLELPVKVDVPVKFEENLVVGGKTINVPEGKSVDLSAIKGINATNVGTVNISKPTVVLKNNEDGTLGTVLILPVKDQKGRIVGFTSIELGPETVKIEVTTGNVIKLNERDVAKVVIDTTPGTATTAGGGYTLQLEGYTQEVQLENMYYSGSFDSKSVEIWVEVDMREAAEQLYGFAVGSITDVNKMLKDMKDIVDEINNALKKINSYELQITDMIDSVYDNYLKKYLDIINKFVVNNVNATNRRFGPFMVASGPKGFKRMSTFKDQPTVLEGDNINFYPTTKTLELLVPLARKHVAVTNVFKETTSATGTSTSGATEVSALPYEDLTGGDPDCLAKMRAMNETEDLNKVFDGTVRKVDADGMVRGYVYEIAYSVLDFDGNMRTRRYYVKLK